MGFQHESHDACGNHQPPVPGWANRADKEVNFHHFAAFIPFIYMVVSINGGTGYPQIIHILVGFCSTNHPLLGTPILGNPHIVLVGDGTPARGIQERA